MWLAREGTSLLDSDSNGEQENSVRLRRSPFSRLVGDGRFGSSFLPSQVLFGFLAYTLYPFGLIVWLVLVPSGAFALVAVLWTARIRGNDLVCSVLGVRVLVVDLARSKGAGVEDHIVKLTTYWIVVLRSPHVTFRAFDRYRRPIRGELKLRQTGGLRRKQALRWAHVISRVSHEAKRAR